MCNVNIALLGFGTVGKGVFETLQTYKQRIERSIDADINVSTIVIQHPEKHREYIPGTHITSDINAILKNPDIDIVFEAIVGKEPAFTYTKQCIQKGKSVITANKEMFAHHGKALKLLADEHHVALKYDATTAGGIPIIQTIQELLNMNSIQKVEAILNGTSNYILTSMRDKGISFDAALEEAQQLGYAEADPTNDIAGYDAFFKIMILSDLIYDDQPNWENAEIKGITDTGDHTAKKRGDKHGKIKHIATLYRSNNQIHAHVRPESIHDNHPLYSIEGVENAVHIQTDIIGGLTLTGPGAGAFPTASAMIEDLCIVMKEKRHHQLLQI